MKISVAAVAVWLAFAGSPPSPTPAPTKCCSECKGTGMVLTGDGIARVPCPCPSTCPCAKNRPSSQKCATGVCQ